MARYAQTTTVSSAKSRDEIERTLTRYGASGFMYGWQEDSAVVAFKMDNRSVKFTLPLPDRNDKKFTHTPTTEERRSTERANTAWEQACRQRWRALALVIKAKLEAVEAGITIFDEEFLAHLVLPDGQTVGQFMVPQVAIAYDKGTMPPLLGHG